MNLKHWPSQTATALHQGRPDQADSAAAPGCEPSIQTICIRRAPPARSGHACIFHPTPASSSRSSSLHRSVQFSANRAFLFCFVFSIQSSLIADLQLMCGSVSGGGTKGGFVAGTKTKTPPRQNPELCGRRQAVGEAHMLQNSPPLPTRIHFNGKFVVKCPPPND